MKKELFKLFLISASYNWSFYCVYSTPSFLFFTIFCLFNCAFWYSCFYWNFVQIMLKEIFFLNFQSHLLFLALEKKTLLISITQLRYYLMSTIISVVCVRALSFCHSTDVWLLPHFTAPGVEQIVLLNTVEHQGFSSQLYSKWFSMQ